MSSCAYDWTISVRRCRKLVAVLNRTAFTAIIVLRLVAPLLIPLARPASVPFVAIMPILWTLPALCADALGWVREVLAQKYL
jgi:hypothetical protein